MLFDTTVICEEIANLSTDLKYPSIPDIKEMFDTLQLFVEDTRERKGLQMHHSTKKSKKYLIDFDYYKDINDAMVDYYITHPPKGQDVKWSIVYKFLIQPALQNWCIVNTHEQLLDNISSLCDNIVSTLYNCDTTKSNVPVHQSYQNLVAYFNKIKQVNSIVYAISKLRKIQ